MLLSTRVCGFVNSGLLVLLLQPGLMQTLIFPKGSREGISRQNSWDWVSPTGIQLQRDFCPILKALATRQNKVGQKSLSPTPNCSWSHLKLPSKSLRERFICWDFRPWSRGHFSDFLEKNESSRRDLLGISLLCPAVSKGWLVGQSLGHRHRKLQRHPWHQVPPWPGGVFWTLLKNKSRGFTGLLFLHFR